MAVQTLRACRGRSETKIIGSRDEVKGSSTEGLGLTDSSRIFFVIYRSTKTINFQKRSHSKWSLIVAKIKVTLGPIWPFWKLES